MPSVDSSYQRADEGPAGAFVLVKACRAGVIPPVVVKGRLKELTTR
jgi:hypothetical protein